MRRRNALAHHTGLRRGYRCVSDDRCRYVCPGRREGHRGDLTRALSRLCTPESRLLSLPDIALQCCLVDDFHLSRQAARSRSSVPFDTTQADGAR